MQVSESIEISTHKEKVWAVITDIENSHNRITNIVGIEILDRPSEGLIGLKWRETRTFYGKEASEVMWITEAESNAYYCTRAESHGSVYLSRLSLNETNGITTLTMSFTGKSITVKAKILSALMSGFIKKSLKKEISKDLLDIKNFMEQSG